MSYVLAVATTHRVATGAGTCPAGTITRGLPRRAWQRYPAGAGAKGHRWYDWAWASIDAGLPGCRWLLIRRSRRTGELAFYRCYSPRPVPLATLVKIAGLRWTRRKAGEGERTRPARHRLPHHRRRARARPPPGTGRPDPADPQRNRRAIQRTGHPAGMDSSRAPPAMVNLAATPPAPR